MEIPTPIIQRLFNVSTPSIIWLTVAVDTNQQVIDLLNQILACCNANNALLKALPVARSGGAVAVSTVTTGLDLGLLKQIHQLLLGEVRNRSDRELEMRNMKASIKMLVDRRSERRF